MTYVLAEKNVISEVAETGIPTISADSNQTWTVAQMLAGLLRRTLTATARTDTTPTAAQLVAALPGAAAGTYFYLNVTRTDAAAVNLTISGGTNVTYHGTATVAASSNRVLLVVLTTVTLGSEAVDIYSLGSQAV